MNELSLLNTRPLARRSPLAISLILHAGLLSLLTLVHAGGAAAPDVAPERHHHSVIVLNLRDFRSRSKPSGESSAKSQTAGLHAPSKSGTAPKGETRHTPGPELATVADPGASKKQVARAFELPPDTRVHAVKQTLMQFDVPPDVVLKQPVPLPNIVLWTEQRPSPFRKRFVAPPVKISPVKVSQTVAPAPELPNHEPVVSDLKLAANPTPPAPRLFHAPATRSPVRMPAPAAVNQTPQIALPDSSAAEPTALVALADSPTRPNGMVIVPPANQISNEQSAGSSGGTGSGSASSGAGQGGPVQSSSAGGVGAGAGSTISAGAGSGPGSQNAGSNGDGKAGVSAGNGSGLGNTGKGEVAGISGSGSAGGGVGTGTGGNGTGDSGLDQLPAGVTRITLPKEGRFGVVVTGSSQSTPYPETIGALSGKMVYTVYLSVGLHKKWILQYCLTKDAARLVSRGSATPLEAPWPFLVFRPDHLAQPGDYVVVHGLIDTDGRFDQLAMVFPDQFDQKDLLISSLKHWSFRPASRDRQPTAVEILLIIPAES